MSSKNEEAYKLKTKIIECQEETLQLLQESQRRRDKCIYEGEAKARAVAALKLEQLKSMDSIIFEKGLENLNNHLKLMEETEAELKPLLERKQVRHAERKKFEEKSLTKREHVLDRLERYDQWPNIKLHKTRIEMEKRLESLNRFCEAVYSTLGSTGSSSVSVVKEAQLDHPDGQEMRKLRGSKKTQ